MELREKVTDLRWLADDLVQKLKNDQVKKMVLSNNGDESVLQDDYSGNMKKWVESMYDSI